MDLLLAMSKLQLSWDIYREIETAPILTPDQLGNTEGLLQKRLGNLNLITVK